MPIHKGFGLSIANLLAGLLIGILVPLSVVRL
jgi:hypothetical protein